MVSRQRARRGEIWFVVLDPTEGREIQKTRPCLVISPDSLNANLDTVTIMPMTTGSRAAPFRVPVTFAGKQGLLLADQIRTIDVKRTRGRIGMLDPATLGHALAILREMFMD
ncbi:MAG: type II toxin-antitoxin system PemK/MazF family toxin [Novosphingobium sp.]|nr:type II toxin-antitoxin system PemK/MazF family toxin [Novosphingobium sp.]